MKLGRTLLRLAACAVLFALDALLSRLCVTIDAAGALLSPGGAVSIDAALGALGFLLVRLALVGGLALTAALFAGDLVGAAFRAAGTSRSRRRT